jgi:pSer/pThr/pTyr-binding forkhead associated (FHA) protein
VIRHAWPSPGEGRVVAVLEVVGGASARHRIEIRAPRVGIGSAPDNEAVLQGDEYVSSHHAQVRAEASGLYIVDLGSTNGSELNGMRFKDATRALAPGDRLTFGRTTLEVMLGDAAHRQRPMFEQPVR